MPTVITLINRGGNIDNQRSGILTAGGYMAIFAGIVGIGGGFLNIAYREVLASLMEETFEYAVSPSIFVTIGVLSIIAGLCAILGGRYALWKKRFMLAVTCGGICGFIASFLVLSVIGMIFGILPLIFITMSRKEFV